MCVAILPPEEPGVNHGKPEGPPESARDLAPAPSELGERTAVILAREGSYVTGGARRRRTLRPLPQALAGLGRLTIAGAAAYGRRTVERTLRRGSHGAPIGEGPPTVLLFFEDLERDRFAAGDRHLRRAARKVYHAATYGQQESGFEVAFRLLRTALTRAGCRVVVNNPSLARAFPAHPIGICGYPHRLERWPLPNPALLGPGMLDHPALRARLFDDHRFRSYIVTSDWTAAVFEEGFPGRCRRWFAGIDTDAWPDARGEPKSIDFLVYDKLRTPTAREALAEPLSRELARRGLRCHRLAYPGYEPARYRDLLARSRGLLFLSESETQGLAYQEALASNVPVLAWDCGYWPDAHRTTGERIPASSVPYFSPACGERFSSSEEFAGALTRFLDRRPFYEPRRFVCEHLSLQHSAELYLAHYREAGQGRLDSDRSSAIAMAPGSASAVGA